MIPKPRTKIPVPPSKPKKAAEPITETKPVDEFDQLFEEIASPNEDTKRISLGPLAGSPSLIPEQVESKFEDIFHSYEENGLNNNQVIKNNLLEPVVPISNIADVVIVESEQPDQFAVIGDVLDYSNNIKRNDMVIEDISPLATVELVQESIEDLILIDDNEDVIEKIMPLGQTEFIDNQYVIENLDNILEQYADDVDDVGDDLQAEVPQSNLVRINGIIDSVIEDIVPISNVTIVEDINVNPLYVTEMNTTEELIVIDDSRDDNEIKIIEENVKVDDVADSDEIIIKKSVSQRIAMFEVSTYL